VYRVITAVSVAATLLYGAATTQAANLQTGAGAGASGHPDKPEIMMRIRGAAHGHGGGGGGSNNLSYHGGINGTGVETGSDKVYLVYWGSQWNSNDTSNEAAIQQNFFSHVGGSSWNKSVTQYCQGVATGTTNCGPSGTHVPNPTGLLGRVWTDNSVAAPTSPTQSQLAAEAVAAAAHFGNTSAAANTHVQYVINTAHNNNSNGFGSQYCAWHSSTSSSYGNLAYTNMPYITDAGFNCGADFVSGPTDGITIVGGHEFAETETDIFPNGGWLDGSGSENGDKCAWIGTGQGAAAVVSMNGASFPVQSLWSNAFNGNAGGCVTSS
jgi:hypothetical protein